MTGAINVIRAENPKRKSVMHQQPIKVRDCRAAEKLRSGERLTNSEGAGISDAGF